MKRILICFLVFTNISNAQVDLNSGLIAYYPFSGNANDISGNDNHPVFNNAKLTADRFGRKKNAYHFNGINNYMRIPNKAILNTGTQISLFVWVRPTGFYYDICHASIILTKGSGNYQPGNYTLRYDDALYTNGQGCDGELLKDSLHHNFRGTGTTMTPYTPFINKNQWYPVMYTNDGKKARLYVDCELKYEIEFPEDFNNNEDLFIGKMDDPWYPFWLNADLDEIRIYNRALTIEEINVLCEKKTDSVKKIIPEKLVPVEKPKEIIIENRTNELVKQIIVVHDSISVTLYDNGIIDGDSVTLIFNDKILVSHLLLSDQPKTFNIKIAPGNSRNELLMYAENLGSIPPNTALMVIYDGEKRYEVNISSTATSNGVVSFRLRE